MSEDSKWEAVDVVMSPYGHPSTVTYRLPVPGGWLYRVEDGDAQSVVFVPAPPAVSRVASDAELAVLAEQGKKLR